MFPPPSDASGERFVLKVYLTYADWQGKRNAKKEETFIATTGELPETAINKATEDEEEGNRRFRRMAKKEKQKAEE